MTKSSNKVDLVLKDEVYAIVGAAMEVHRQLGLGFLEPVYHEAIELELAERKIPFETQKRFPIHYKGRALNKEYCADLVCFAQIIVKLKALDCLTGREESQVLNYLKISRLPVGLLINFGGDRLEWKRFVM